MRRRVLIEQEEPCKLFDTFGKTIQLVCGIVALSVLIVKRCRERPRRPWKIWGMDVSKQASSGLCAHFIGMITAEIMASHTANVDPCGWYLIAFTVDTTVGVAASFGFLKLVVYFAAMSRNSDLADSGNYQHEVGPSGQLIRQPVYRIWLKQAAAWALLCVVPARFLCMGLVYLLRDGLMVIAIEISGWFEGHRQMELVVVMLVGPLCLNALQFFIQDTVLKFSKDQHNTHTILLDQDELAAELSDEDTSDAKNVRLSPI